MKRLITVVCRWNCIDGTRCFYYSHIHMRKKIYAFLSLSILLLFAPVVTSASCNIKGNIAYTTWERIYHLPWCWSYNKTTINTSYWERWFCSEAEARNAWRRKANNCWGVYYTSYTPTYTVTCSSSQCKLWNTCYTRPANASCSSNWVDAWVCKSWYIESGNSCISNTPKAPTVTQTQNRCIYTAASPLDYSLRNVDKNLFCDYNRPGTSYVSSVDTCLCPSGREFREQYWCGTKKMKCSSTTTWTTYKNWTTLQSITPPLPTSTTRSQTTKTTNLSYAWLDAEILKRMYRESLTKYSSRNKFRPYDPITRGEVSKFLTAYWWYVGIIPNSDVCSFSDLGTYDYTLVPHVEQACRMWMIKWHNWYYYPNNHITKAEALAVVLRPFVGMLDETWAYWYQEYYTIWRIAWLTTQDVSQMNTPISRYEIGKRMYETIVFYVATTIWASNDNDFWSVSCDMRYPWTRYNPINSMCECSDWSLRKSSYGCR